MIQDIVIGHISYHKLRYCYSKQQLPLYHSHKVPLLLYENDIYLNLPDPMETLRDNPDYSIQLANEGVWEAETGYNSLLMRINVTSDEKTDIYNGDLVFTKK